MAENGVNGKSHSDGKHLKVGLVNTSNRYLTAEKFGGKVNATGTSLKLKQVWTLEPSGNDNLVYIKSQEGKYLVTEKLYGEVNCTEEREDAQEFSIEYSKDGRWAFKNKGFGYYLSSTSQKCNCFSKKADEAEWWFVQLYIHPQVHLKNDKRDKYGHLNAETDVLEFTEVVPWGSDSMLMLDFVNGKYSLRTCDNRYLCRDGTLKALAEEGMTPEHVGNDSLYCIEIYDDKFAFKDVDGFYLSCKGGTGVMRSGKRKDSPPTKDEMFIYEDSHPQVRIIAHNDKNLSIKQGVHVSANQDEVSDTEIFQLVYNKEAKKWAILGTLNKFWNYDAASGGVQADSSEPSKPKNLFDIEWQENGWAAIKVCDGKYISNRATGAIYATSTTVGTPETFKIIILNRPVLVLKCEHGFIGTGPKETYICNKPKCDTVQVELKSEEKASYAMKGAGGKYWCLNSDNCVAAEGNTKTDADDFWFEFVGSSCLLIRARNDMYVRAEQTGLLKAAASREEATWFEF